MAFSCNLAGNKAQSSWFIKCLQFSSNSLAQIFSSTLKNLFYLSVILYTFQLFAKIVFSGVYFSYTFGVFLSQKMWINYYLHSFFMIYSWKEKIGSSLKMCRMAGYMKVEHFIWV